MFRYIPSLINFLVIVIIFTITTYSQQGWYWSNPRPQGNDLAGIKFLNNNTGYAVGMCGTIIKTTNSGENWFKLNSRTTSDLNDCSFVNENTGFVVGYQSTVLKTTNGGMNWISLNIGFQNLILYGVSFINANTGIVSYDGSSVFKTTNGGQYWSYYSTGGGTINSIQMIDSVNVYASGSWRIYKSTNGGINWSITSGFAFLYQINFIDQVTGMTVGNGGQVYMTTDAGSNWLNKSVSSSENLNSVYVLNQNTAVICGYNSPSQTGVIYKTTNGGGVWNNVPINTAALLNKTNFLGNSFGTIVGDCGVISISTDGGNSWQMKSNGSIKHIDELQVVDTTAGFAVGFYVVLKSSDGGATWNSILEPNINLQALYFINKNTGYIAGTNSLNKTINGGLNWMSQFYNIPNGTIIYGMYIQDSLKGLCVCNNGLVLKTINGGNNWLIVATPTSNHMFSVKFTGSTIGYIAGYNGTVLKTSNSGDTWGIVRNVAGQHLYGLCFSDSNTGIAVGKSGLITKTTNGGLNWSTQISGTNRDLNDVKLLWGNIWVAAGNQGTVLFTSNGGNNWYTQPLMTKNDLFSISARDSNFYIAGYFGTILRSSVNSLVTDITSINTVIPKDFTLSQNFPNPFNPVTVINYHIPYSVFVSIKVYDVTGREIITLVSDLKKQGYYRVSFDGTNFASGVYFYRMQAGDYTFVKKMVLYK